MSIGTSMAESTPRLVTSCGPSRTQSSSSSLKRALASCTDQRFMTRRAAHRITSHKTSQIEMSRQSFRPVTWGSTAPANGVPETADDAIARRSHERGGGCSGQGLSVLSNGAPYNDDQQSATTGSSMSDVPIASFGDTRSVRSLTVH